MRIKRPSPRLTAHLAAFDCFAPLARRFSRQIFVKMTQPYKRIARKMSKKMPKRFRQRRDSYCSLTVYHLFRHMATIAPKIPAQNIARGLRRKRSYFAGKEPPRGGSLRLFLF